MKTFKKIGVGFLLWIALSGMAQDIHFSQTEFSPLTLNPALVGANYDFEASLNYRNQWTTVGKPFQTTSVSIASRLNVNNNAFSRQQKKVHLAAGLDFFNDNVGLIKVLTNSVNLHFATHIILKEGHTLGLGISGGWGQRSINPADGRWGSQYDGENYNSSLSSGENFNRASFQLFDLASGMVYTYQDQNARRISSKRINVGVGAFHLTRPSYSFLNQQNERMYIRFTGFFNGEFGISGTRSSILPGVYYQRQGSANEIIVGAYWKYKIVEASQITNFVDEFSFSVGAFYRNKDAMIAKLLLEWKGVALGFAYDVNLFNSLVLSSKSVGAFEFSIRYLIPDYSRRSYLSGGRMIS